MTKAKQHPRQDQFDEWEKKRRHIVHMMRDKGMTPKEIGHELGITANSVYKIMEKMRHRFNARTNFQLFQIIKDGDQLAARPFERWIK